MMIFVERDQARPRSHEIYRETRVVDQIDSVVRDDVRIGQNDNSSLGERRFDKKILACGADVNYRSFERRNIFIKR